MHWCNVEGTQPLACIQSRPSKMLYFPLTSTMKKAVGIVLLPTMSSFDTTPLASLASPENPLRVMFIFIRSFSPPSNFLNKLHSMMFMQTPLSTSIRFTDILSICILYKEVSYAPQVLLASKKLHVQLQGPTVWSSIQATGIQPVDGRPC
jgi:hypothetical protein